MRRLKDKFLIDNIKQKMSFLMIMLLAINMVEPDSLCDKFKCGSFYTTSNVRVDSCLCNNNTKAFVYPAGQKFVDVNYNMTSYPITHDFYQNHTLVGSCPKGLFCSQTIPLNPIYSTVSSITAHLDDYFNMTDEDEYELFFYPG
jgi:hypothetical protein